MLHLGQGEPDIRTDLENSLRAALGEKELGVLMDEKLNMRLQSLLTVWKTNCYRDCIKKRSGQLGEGRDCTSTLPS